MSPRIVLVHNILPPYRVALFDAVGRECELHVVLAQLTHTWRRGWQVPQYEGLHFGVHLLRACPSFSRWSGMELAFGVSELLRRLQPDVVVLAGWDQFPAWFARRFCLRHDVPTVLWIESSDGSGELRGRISTYARKSFLATPAVCIVPGRAAEEFVLSLGFKGRVIHMANAVALNESSVPLAANVGNRTVLFAGELSERKGYDLFVEAALALRSAGYRVLSAGSGPLGGHSPYIEELGHLDASELARVMIDASVVVLPSRRDPWPLVAAEAVTLGRPVVLGSGVSSFRDLVDMDGVVAVSMLAGTSGDLVSSVEVAFARRDDARPTRAFAADVLSKNFLEAVHAASEK